MIRIKSESIDCEFYEIRLVVQVGGIIVDMKGRINADRMLYIL